MERYDLIVYSVCLCIFIYGCLISGKFRFPPKNRLPPGPKGLPVVGNLFMLGKKPHESLAKLAKVHGPLMTLQLGFQTTIVVSSADMAKEVLQKNDHVLSGRMVIDAVRALDHHKRSLTWGQTGPHWRMVRKIYNNHLFNVGSLDALQGLRKRAVEQLLDEMHETCSAMKSIVVGHCVYKAVTNFLYNTLFSVNLVDPKSGSAKELMDLVREVFVLGGTPNFSDFFPVLRPFDLQGIRRRSAKCFVKLHTYLDEIIQQRLRSRSLEYKGARDLLDILLDQCEDSGSELKLEDIKPLLQDIIFAGIETTTSTIEWAMAELLRNKSIMVKAQFEIAETIGRNQIVTESDINRLPYLQAIVKEVFRFYPPAPLLLPHRAEAITELAGYTVPKGTQIIINAWAIGRDDHFWKDPLTFSPERFLDSHMDFKGHHFQLIPLGAGRRICPGLPLADRMIHMILASLLQSFDWKLPEEGTPQQSDMRDELGFTLRKATPLIAIPCKV